MWGKKKPDTTRTAEPEPTNLQTNQPPKPASASWEGTTKMNKDVMRPGGEIADRAPSRLGSSLHLKGEISGDEDLAGVYCGVDRQIPKSSFLCSLRRWVGITHGG
jgi:hypothetical protein